MHVIASVEGRLVEIQVRTKMQDLWAQAMERLADKVGREIRYGGKPRAEIAAFGKLMEAVEAVANLEERLDELVRLHGPQIEPMRAGLREQSGAVQSILAGIAVD